MLSLPKPLDENQPNIIQFQLQSQFQRLLVLYQTLCVFTQMKDTFNISDDEGGGGGVKKYFFKHGHVAYQIDGDDEQNKNASKIIFILGSNW